MPGIRSSQLRFCLLGKLEACVGGSLGFHLFVVIMTDGFLDGAEAISIEELHQFFLDAAHQPGSLVHQTLVMDDNTTIRQHASDSRTGAR